MTNHGLRTPWRAPRPLAALSAMALILGLALPALAATPQGAIRVLELTPDGALKSPPPGYKVREARSLVPYVPDGMALGSETEPNDTSATANPIAGSEAHILGNVTPGADADYFSFTALAGDRVYAAVQTLISNNSTDSQLELFASDGTTRIEFDDDDGSFGSLSSVIAGAVIPADGTYYLRVDGFSASTLVTPYHFHFRLESGSPTPEVEPNNDPASATPLPAGGWVSGNIDTTTDPDWFSFALNAGDSVYIALDANPERDANRWDPRVGEAIFGGFILVANDTGAGSATDEAGEAFFMTAKDAGTYYAYVDSTVATGLGPNATYQMVVNIIPKQVQSDCTIVPSTDTPLPLGPGVNTVTSTIVVPATLTYQINDVNVLMDLTHSSMPDLDVFLASPAATSVQLYTDIGASAVTAMNLGLDDTAALPIGPYTVVSGMVNEPEGGAGAGRLSSFIGQGAGGAWTLSLTDDTANALGGTLNSWSLEICGPPPPPFGLTLTKTVGLDPAVCGTASSLTVPPGTTVYYCVTVRNVGLNDLTTHDLVDDQLGTIFSGLAFTLTPGTSIDTVALGVTISATLQSTTTNTATWTGHNGPDSASAEASATVTVPTHCTPPLQDVTLAFSDFTGTFPPAGWTVANTSTGCVPPGLPDWTNTNPGGRANLTGSVGPFAIADSDRCGSGSVLDTTLDTPALDLTTLTDPVVHFKTDYDDIGTGDGSTAVLEVSNDGGATFTPVFTWDEDHRGPLAIDQPIPGAGGSAIVRWHYVNGTWDWWWEVDEPWVTACAEPTASISLDKTVGTVPAVCASTDSITVNTGTSVYYCYTVTNTGAATFEFHDLVDDQLGTLLDDAPFTLAPGDSAELIVPDVATAPVTNTATWTAATNLPGYTVDDTIPYDFTDITGTGTALVLGDDEMSVALPMGFSFDFFGTAYTDAYLCANGFITLLPGQFCPFVPTSIPTPGNPDGLIGAWWSDLYPPGGGTIHYETLGSAPNRVFVVQFTNIGHCCGGANPSTFEFKLFEGSNNIEAHYATADTDGSHNHVVGIENQDGTLGTSYYEGIAGLTTPLAVRYSVAAPPLTASATDTATVAIEDPDIQVSPTEISSFQPVDTQTTHDLDITNIGPADLDWTITEDPGLAGGRRIARLPGRDRPILPNRRSAPPAPDAEIDSPVSPDLSFSRAEDAKAGKSVTPERGQAPDATVTITHSSSQAIVTGNSVSCNGGGLHTDNSYIRRFTLTDFGIGGNFNVIQVEVGIEQAFGAGGTQPAVVNLYTWNPADPFLFGNFNPIGTVSTSVPDQSLSIITVPVTGTAPAGSTLVVEFFTPNGQAAGNSLFVGSNADPETDATFLAAADCGVPEPVPTADIGFPDMHLVMNVTGTTGCDADLPWLSASPTSGTTTTGNTDTVTVTLDSTGLTPGGTYTGAVCVNSNDPDTPELQVPVTLDVDGMPFLDGFETGDTSRWSFQVP